MEVKTFGLFFFQIPAHTQEFFLPSGKQRHVVNTAQIFKVFCNCFPNIGNRLFWLTVSSAHGLMYNFIYYFKLFKILRSQPQSFSGGTSLVTRTP